MWENHDLAMTQRSKQQKKIIIHWRKVNYSTPLKLLLEGNI